MTNLEHALTCAEMGWFVFPSRNKMPLVKWSTNSTLSPDSIKTYWEMWPDADVCIRTGADSNLVVVDWDAYKGDSVLWPLDGPDPRSMTYTATTPRGGLHFYFTHPGYPVANSAGVVAPHVDVRGDGGMVVAYQPLWDRTLAPIPEAWITKRERTVDYTAELTPPHNPDAEPKGWSQRVLEVATGSVRNAQDGIRNATLYQVASDMYRSLCWEGAIGLEYVSQALGDAAYANGLDPEEVAATLLSAQRNAASKKGEE